MIDKGEKLLQEKKSILSFAECPVCSEYLTSPIFQCITGHSICKECKNKLVKCPSCNGTFNSTRNFSLEKIIDNMSFPCSNAEFGCDDMILLKQKDEHSKCCEYRLYDCLPGKRRGCTWRGRRQDILTHINETHKGLVWKGERNAMGDIFCFDSDDVKLKCDLISAHDEIFWLQRHKDTEEQTYYMSVHYIGPRENCEKYAYTLSFISSSDPLKNIKFSMCTHPDSVETEEIKTMGCFSIKQCLARSCGWLWQLCYEIEIIKTL